MKRKKSGNFFFGGQKLGGQPSGQPLDRPLRKPLKGIFKAYDEISLLDRGPLLFSVIVAIFLFSLFYVVSFFYVAWCGISEVFGRDQPRSDFVVGVWNPPCKPKHLPLAADLS